MEPYILNGREFLPEELIASFLTMLKKEAQKRTSEPLDGAVLTVPAIYDSGQRSLMEQAGYEAQFKRVVLVDEPIAAAVYYDQVNKKTPVLRR